jgi:LysR family glycine cleavage system transcriptional activator
MADLRRLPSLAALRAFEAAARHENFSRAAEEIHVTHGAISHQVRSLEEELGVLLFTRHGKRIAITPRLRLPPSRSRTMMPSSSA